MQHKIIYIKIKGYSDIQKWEAKRYPHPHLVLLKFVISKRRSNLYATKKQYNTAFLYKLIVNIVH